MTRWKAITIHFSDPPFLTNSTMPDSFLKCIFRCEYAGSEELVMASVSGDAQLPFEQKVEHEFRTLTSPFVEDVKLFDVLGTTYVVVAHSFNKYSPYPLKGEQIERVAQC